MLLKIIQKRFIILSAALSVVYGKEVHLDLANQLPPCPADYLTDCLLASDGSIWVTSEGKGVYRLFPSKEASKDKADWFDVSYYQGLPETLNYYAIAEDKQGCVWVGTGNMGVAVFNGESWKIYDRENALLGERIFDIAVSPVTGDVAIATSGGVNIYKPKTKEWLDLTRANGLIEDQVEALAYDNKGTLWLGYACGGISQASEKNNYQIAQTDQAKWYWDESCRVRQPMDGAGTGLPSNLCNAVLPTKTGAILLGTDSGVALKSGKDDWRYIRGENYRDKNKGLWSVRVDSSASSKTGPLLLPEDYVTCLAETGDGFWIGFRQKGAILVNSACSRIMKAAKFPEQVKAPFVRSFLALPGGNTYAATYGHGLVKIDEGKGKNQLTITERKESPPHPSYPALKTREELVQEMLKLESGEQQDHSGKKVVFWNEDWATKGDWYAPTKQSKIDSENLGRNYSLLCGTTDMSNDILISPGFSVKTNQILGPHRKEDDSLSVNLHGPAPENNNVLFNPRNGMRNATEWTDARDEYPAGFDGPDIWASVEIPEGKCALSLYFYNYQGQDLSTGALRDYVVEFRDGNLDDLVEKMSMPVLSRTRVKDFHGSGVYKTFIVSGPGTYTFRILNNYSSDAILCGFFITQMTFLEQDEANALKKTGLPLPGKPIASTAENLSAKRSADLSLYRFLKSNGQDVEDFQKLLNIWNGKRHQIAEERMVQAWYKKQDEFVACRSKQYFPYSPRTITFTAHECEAMMYMGIDWKNYLPDSKEKPEISAAELKEKISSISKVEFDELKDQYRNKLLEEISKEYNKQQNEK